jgi:NADH:ubiquinone reductase (H+-translocating)
MKKVVIVGGGFGGLSAAKKLNVSGVETTLIDRRNYHLFQPLLYQVATAGLSPAEIAVPIRAELKAQKNVQVILANVTDIHLQEKFVIAEEKQFPFDYLVLACGSKHSYFKHPEWEEYAPGLKTLEQATEIRRRILLAFELAETEKNASLQSAYLTFVIVGGGPTGVELAGAISEIGRHTLQKDFRHIDPRRTRVILIEAGPRVLSSFSENLSKKATADLTALGVQVWTNTRVTEVTSEGVAFEKDFVRAKTVLWAAGVEPSSLAKKLNSPLDKFGRVIVDKRLNIPGHDNVFVIGDMCALDQLPGLAPVAMQEGAFVARQILLSLRGFGKEEFHYVDKGQMATIGKSKALVQIGKIQFTGFFAWLVWLFIHIYYLIGFKNKFFVFLEWAWSYVTFRKGARLIIHKEWRSSATPTSTGSSPGRSSAQPLPDGRNPSPSSDRT